MSEIAQFYRVFICMWTYLLCSYVHVSSIHACVFDLCRIAASAAAMVCAASMVAVYVGK